MLRFTLSPNFSRHESQDKIYLLNTTEVWSALISRDRGYNKTRQLDYYKIRYVTTNGSADVIKKDSTGNNAEWWLRCASSHYNGNFYSVPSSGYWSDTPAHYTNGVSPAFRIG